MKFKVKFESGSSRISFGRCGVQEESLVPAYNRGRMSLTGGRAKAWCLLIHAEASLSFSSCHR